MRQSDKNQRQLWYTRRGQVVQGPFPAGQISRYIILGRIQLTDEVSADGEVWVPLNQVPEIVPELVQSDLEDPSQRERLEAARRWEDERSRDRRGEEGALNDDQRGEGDRRGPAAPGAQRPRHAGSDRVSEHNERHRRHRLVAGLIAVGVVIFLGTLVMIYRPATKVSDTGLSCAQPPAPGVEWSNCAFEGRGLAHVDLSGAHMVNMRLSRADLSGARLERADLSYSELAVARMRDARLGNAVLVGANLRGADLGGADLTGANLSYADLLGADLTGANLGAVTLDQAIWIDGSVCAPGSIGRCVMVAAAD
ncbi:MAG: pentapeptide repeat-containing protein [Gammaproteobacteria bacterium]|nr:pentapeptide repeat-containing protein [Gammaproteobacteria bacterium]